MNHKNPIGVIFIAYNNKITASEQQNYFEEKINTNCKNDEQLFSQVTRDQYYPCLENIKPGTSFPNYGALCRALGQETKAGNAKKAQMQQWQLYFKYRRESGSNRYTIEEIYESPKAKPLRRSNSPFKDIELVIMWLLLTGQLQEPITYVNLGRKVGMVSEDFCYSNHGETCQAISKEVSLHSRNMIFECIYSCLRGFLSRILERMEKDGVITLHEIKMARLFQVDDQGKDIEVIRPANEKEILLDNQIDTQVLEEIGCKSFQDVYRKNKYLLFRKTKQKRLFECNENLTVYKAIQITLVCPSSVDADRIPGLRECLNAKFLDRCIVRKLPQYIDAYDKCYLCCFFILKDRIIKKSDFDYFFMLFCDKELQSSEVQCAIKQFKREECLD